MKKEKNRKKTEKWNPLTTVRKEGSSCSWILVELKLFIQSHHMCNNNWWIFVIPLPRVCWVAGQWRWGPPDLFLLWHSTEHPRCPSWLWLRCWQEYCPLAAQATAFSMVRGRDLCEKKAHSMGRAEMHALDLGETHGGFFFCSSPLRLSRKYFSHIPGCPSGCFGVGENTCWSPYNLHGFNATTKAEFQELVKCGIFFPKRLM